MWDASDEEIDAVFAGLGKHWDGLDCLIHSVGYAPRDQLEGTYIEAVTREGFRVAHDISAYSFAALAKAGLMDGKRATIHWENQDSFTEEFDEVELTKSVFVVDKKGQAIPGLRAEDFELFDDKEPVPIVSFKRFPV